MRRQSRRFFLPKPQSRAPDSYIDRGTIENPRDQGRSTGTSPLESFFDSPLVSVGWMEGTAFIISSFALQNTPALQTKDLMVSGC